MTSSAFIPIFIISCLIILFSRSYSTRIPLAGVDWSISNGNTLKTAGTVPGTIHTVLFSAKLIDEPYWSHGDTTLAYLVNQSWTFTKSFSLQADFLDLTQFTVHFDQIDTVANITLNECYLGNTTNMFFAYTFDVQKECLKKENILRADFMSPVIYALNQANVYNQSFVPKNCPGPESHGLCHINFIRKEPCSFGWDWGPAFAPIGITGDLYLEGISNPVPPLKLDSVNVVSQSSTTKAWQVDVQLSGGSNGTTYTFDFQLKNTSWSFTTNVTFNQKTTITLSIPNENVQLWWPNGHGDQPLYQLIVSNNNQELGSRLIGFRTIELVQDTYGPNINGSSFYFRVNSRPIFVKGSNWIPPDAFQERVTNERLERLLTAAKLANMNMLRVWGGGVYERDYFYEAADRLGIMLWHDFMFACALYPIDDAFLSNVRNEILYQVQRLQSHPSIVLWSGNNENELIISAFFAGSEAIKTDYRKLYIDTVMAAVNEIDPNGSRPFVASSPSNGIESVQENYTAKNPNDPVFGDVHYYSYFADAWDGDTYPITRFLSETGVQSMPSLKTWLQVTNSSEDLNFIGTFVEYRNHHGNGQQEMITRITLSLSLPMTKDPLTNFTQLIYLSQINQAMTLKGVSDHCRLYSSINMINPNTSQGNTMGLMYWQLNDIWQAATWASIEYDLTWKMAHYYARDMYSPIYVLLKLTPYLASVTDDNAQLSVYLVNDFVDNTHNQVNCSIHSFDTFDARLSVTYDVMTNLPDVQLIHQWSYKSLMEQTRCLSSAECLMRCSLSSNGQLSNEFQTLFFARPKDIHLYKPNLRTVSIQQRSSTEIDFTIQADKPALFVWLEIQEGVSGYFSRNGFHMFEVETTITFTSWTSLTNFNIINVDLSITSLFDVTQP